jgi:hypothetical protein
MKYGAAAGGGERKGIKFRRKTPPPLTIANWLLAIV